MIANKPGALSRLCVHTITTKPWSIEEAAKQYAACGVKGITVWREALEGRDIADTGKMLRDHGLTIVSLCRGGFFPHPDKLKRKAAIEENKRAIDEANTLGAPLLVLVCGADPSQPLADSRLQIEDGINAIVPHSLAAGVKLAIEPLHPMYADTRSAINTISQANDLASKINSVCVGVAIDVYHVWWDPELEKEIHRCGAQNKLFAFHICDWKVPTIDFLQDRGLMGDGCIPVKQITSWVEAAGFSGFHEVEIFSNHYWKLNQVQFLKQIINAYQANS